MVSSHGDSYSYLGLKRSGNSSKESLTYSCLVVVFCSRHALAPILGVE
jgi:hypothetical protein